MSCHHIMSQEYGKCEIYTTCKIWYKGENLWLRSGFLSAFGRRSSSSGLTPQTFTRTVCSERLLDNSRIRQLADCQLADWTTRGLDISWTGQLAD